jgi:hypothetical protein
MVDVDAIEVDDVDEVDEVNDVVDFVDSKVLCVLGSMEEIDLADKPLLPGSERMSRLSPVSRCAVVVGRFCVLPATWTRGIRVLSGTITSDPTLRLTSPAATAKKITAAAAAVRTRRRACRFELASRTFTQRRLTRRRYVTLNPNLRL